MFGDIEFTVRVVGQAVSTCLVVRSTALHRCIVLSNVEVDRPRAQGVGHRFVGGPELLFAVVRLDERDARLELAQREAELRQAEARIETELRRHEERIVRVIDEEERKFLETYERGRQCLQEEMERLPASGERTDSNETGSLSRLSSRIWSFRSP